MKVAKDFSQIEKEAEMADRTVFAKEDVKMTDMKLVEEKVNVEVSMKLAYQDLGGLQKKNEVLSRMDPKKAEQMNRLGMGFGDGLGFGGARSHSLTSGMSVIVQEEPSSERKTKSKFFDDFEEGNSLSGGNACLDAIYSPDDESKSSWQEGLKENGSKSAAKSSPWERDLSNK